MHFVQFLKELKYFNDWNNPSILKFHLTILMNLLLLMNTGTVQGKNNHPPRQPRVQTDHTGVRVLRRMLAQVRQRQRVEVLHRPVWLPAAHSAGGRTDFLSARRPVSLHRYSGPHPRAGPPAGGSSRGAHVWPTLVRPRRQGRLGHLTARSRLHLRSRHLRDVQPQQRPDAGVPSPPAGHGRVQLVPWPQRGDHLQCPQLLLPLRQPGRHHGAGRCA